MKTTIRSIKWRGTRAIFIFAAVLGWSARQLAADSVVWSQGPDLPVVFEEVRAAVLNGKLYAVGGRTGQGSGQTCTNTVLVFDPVSNQWSYAAPLPEKLAAVGLATHGGYLYCFGGIYEPYWWGWPVSSAYRYNPTNKAWTRLTDMPIARSNFGITVMGDKIYCAGGNIQWPNATSRVDVYDTTAQSWSTVASMPGARGSAVCGAWAGKVVVAMGLASASASASKTAFTYDPRANQWTQVTLTNSLGHESGSLFSDDEGLYCMGERDGVSKPTCISRLHPTTGLVDFLTPASPRMLEGVMAQAYDPTRGVCYAVGGWTTTRTRTFQMATIGTAPPAAQIELVSGTDGLGHLLTLGAADPLTSYTSASDPAATDALVGKGQPIGPETSDYFGTGKSQTVTVDNLTDTWADFTTRFTLPPSNIYTLRLDFVVDDGAKVYLNGWLLGTFDQRDAQNIFLLNHLEVTNQSYFLPGTNELKFQLINTFTGQYNEGAIKARSGVDGLSVQYQGSVSLLLNQPTIYYVNGSSGSDTNSGLSWQTAKRTIQDALALTVPGDAVWVAHGTYVPGSARTNAFVLKSGVSLFGGFNGTESSPAERDVAVHPTVLSGDLSGNDNGFAGTAENAYHVVILTNNTTLDGMLVQGGNANAASAPNCYGGGIYCLNSTNVSVRNCDFAYNSAGEHGGAFCCDNSFLDLSGCRFATNSATRAGGLWIAAGRGAITGCTFLRCSTTERPGGGIYFSGTQLTIDRCAFLGNSSGYGGGIYGGFNGQLTLRNSIFSLNRCGGNSQGGTSTGGAFWLENHAVASVVNCTLTGNSDANGLQAVHCYDSVELAMTNCIIWNNLGLTIGGDLSSHITLDHCDVSGGLTGFALDASSTATNAGGLLDLNPRFVANANPHTEYYGDLHLQPGSPCIDSGTTIAGLSNDYEGDPRPAHGGVALGFDIGADEFVAPLTLAISVSGEWVCLSLRGQVDRPVTVECSTNLTDPNSWTPFINFVLPYSPFTVCDNAPSQLPQKFYRAFRE